ncbi:MAG: ArdC family protein [Sarcina sp.]
MDTKDEKVVSDKKEEKIVNDKKDNNEIKDKIEKLHKFLVDEIKSFKENTKAYMKFLDLFRRNSYSLNNNLYINEQLVQKNEALGEEYYKGNHMTTFKGWKDLGYSVNKGEKAVQLFFPRKVDYFRDENNEFKLLRYANKEQKQKIASGILESGTYNTYFAKGALFDIRQTNCPESEVETVMSKLTPQRLEEVDNKKMDSLIQDLQEHLRKDGFKVESKYIDNGAKGYVTTNKEIVLHSENTNTQNFKTLLHELAHWNSEHLGERRNEISRDMREIEAESIAYIVCKNQGVDTSDYSFAYLHGYGKNHVDEDIIKSQIMIKKIANDINNTLDNLYQLRLEKISLQKEIEEKYGELNVKILKSENLNIKEGEILSLKSLNKLVEERGISSDIKIGILDEENKKVVSFELKNNNEKSSIYEQINGSDKLKSIVDNKIKTTTPVNLVESKLTIRFTNSSISVEM